jgi:hypothetical protein
MKIDKSHYGFVETIFAILEQNLDLYFKLPKLAKTGIFEKIKKL